MAQEAVTQALTFGGTFNQAGNIGYGVAGVASLHHTQVGNQSGEGVVSDLGAGRRNCCNEGGLTG